MGGLYAGLFLLAAAMLGLEISLTRVFALAQWYHFAFMAISVALLGVGAGGTVLSLAPGLKRQPQHVAGLAAAGCALATLGGYLAANALPFDAYRIAWDPAQFLYLALYYLVLAAPFFCASLATGVLLSTSPQRSHRVYAANLLGSAAGCGLAPLVLSWVGGAGSVGVWAALAGLAATAFSWVGVRRSAAQLGATSPFAAPPNHTSVRILAGGVGLTLTLICLALAVARPAWLEVRLSPYKGLPQALQAPGAALISQRWNAVARVDVVASPSLHAAPGLSLGCQATQPAQQALFVDGDNPSPRLLSDPGALRPWAGCLPLALPFSLRPGADSLVLEPGGNLDPLLAQSLGAGRVTVVEPNRLLVDAAGGDPGAKVVVESGRAFLRRTRARYDVVDLALSGSRNVVTTGAYSLGEEYRYTVEGVADALARLNDGGLLAISRWIQSPPSEELRAWALAVRALERSGVSDVKARLAAIRSWSTVLILVKNGPFTDGELAAVRAFCAARQFDLVYLPDMRPDEGNRYNVYPGDPYAAAFRGLVETPDRQAFYAAQAYDVRPPTDDRPFFFHFFTWRQVPAILSELGHTWKPFGGGGYLVLLALLALAIVMASILVLLPLAKRRAPPQSPPWPPSESGAGGRRRILPASPLCHSDPLDSEGTGRNEGGPGPAHKEPVYEGRREADSRRGLPLKWERGRALAYFGLLGVGFLAIEIPLMQRFILFLGHPTTAFAAVVASLLLFSGVGSLLARRVPHRRALLVLVVAIGLTIVGLGPLFRALLGTPLAIRLLATGLSLAPLGLLLGMPFPLGLARLEFLAPELVPWAWAVNGSLSVVASVAIALGALGAGFTRMLGVGVLAYLAAALLL